MNADMPVTCAARLDSEINRLGLSLERAAAIVGVPLDAMQFIKRGAMPGADVLQALAKAGADTHYILTGVRRPDQEQIMLSRDMASLCRRQLRLAQAYMRRTLAAAEARGDDYVVALLAGDIEEIEQACSALEPAQERA